jgi:hypothetical protein
MQRAYCRLAHIERSLTDPFGLFTRTGDPGTGSSALSAIFEVGEGGTKARAVCAAADNAGYLSGHFFVIWLETVVKYGHMADFLVERPHSLPPKPYLTKCLQFAGTLSGIFLIYRLAGLIK